MKLRLMIVESGWLRVGREKSSAFARLRRDKALKRPHSKRFAHNMTKAEGSVTVMRWAANDEWAGDVAEMIRASVAIQPLRLVPSPRHSRRPLSGALKTIHSHRFPSIPSFFENENIFTRGAGAGQSASTKNDGLAGCWRTAAGPLWLDKSESRLIKVENCGRKHSTPNTQYSTSKHPPTSVFGATGRPALWGISNLKKGQ